jgi:uncharacterized SAM-binding protein YcdF (DUF218 family)
MSQRAAPSVTEARLTGALLGIMVALGAALWGVHSVIGFPAMYLAMTLAGVGALLAVRSRRLLIGAASIAAVSAVVLAYTPIVDRLGAPLVRNDATTTETPDAVFVFSAGVTRGGLLRGQGLDRIIDGFAVRRQLGAGPLVLSEVRSDGSHGASSRADQRRLLAMAGVADTAVLSNVQSTRDEAVALAALARTRRWTHVLVITSPMHSRRACTSVERLGLRITCRSAAGRATPWPPRTPTERLQTWPAITYEYVAWVLYRTRGWAAWSR